MGIGNKGSVAYLKGTAEKMVGKMAKEKDFKEIKLKKSVRIVPVKSYDFWCFVPESWSKMIVIITGRKLPDKGDSFSHQGRYYLMSDGSTETYEALFSKGFVGPESFESIINKVHSKDGYLKFIETGFTGKALQYEYKRCRSWVGMKGYNKWQLASMWFFERFGKWLGIHIRRSPDIFVCSEAGARLDAGPEAVVPSEKEGTIIPPYYDLRDEVRTRFDEVNPNSGYRKRLKIKQQATA